MYVGYALRMEFEKFLKKKSALIYMDGMTL